MAYDKEVWRATVENGKIPGNMLDEIVPAQYDPDLGHPGIMHPEAAAAMGALLNTAREGGHPGLATKYTYRTLAKQWEKWANYQAGGNLAAYPGTSNHGWAVSVDFTGLTTEVISWLKANAKRFGYVNDVPTEDWHYTYYGGWTPEEDTVLSDEQLAKIKDSAARWEGLLAYLEASATDERADPPQNKPKAFKEGWRAGRILLNRQR